MEDAFKEEGEWVCGECGAGYETKEEANECRKEETEEEGDIDA